MVELRARRWETSLRDRGIISPRPGWLLIMWAQEMRGAYRMRLKKNVHHAALVLLTLCHGQLAQAGLAEYVAAKDDSYRWEQRARATVDGVRCVEYKMVSQTWHGITWRHLLTIAHPTDLAVNNHALLFIGGSSWNDNLDAKPADPTRLTRDPQRVVQLARLAKMPVAILEHVPFQPIFGGKYEDQAISYTFDQFIRTGDDTWPLLLPMVKSAVRGMDTIQAVAHEEWNLKIQHFTVTGASKRGWTTWLTAVADPRVRAIAPMVIDVLNMGPQMKHQIATWGNYSDQIHDYTDRGLPKMMESPEGKKLTALVDPYSYRAQLKLPKLIILGTNDRYWPLDALNLYWDELEGEKRVLYVPNNGHGLRDPRRVANTISAMALQSAGQWQLPKLDFQWTKPSALQLTLRSDQTPARVLAWSASTPTRDFRDAHWSSRELTIQDGSWHLPLPAPAQGFVAAFAEAEYDLDGHPVFLSTTLRIVASETAGGANPSK